MKKSLLKIDKSPLIALCTVVFSAMIGNSQAEVYRRVNPDGTINYSTTPVDSTDSPASLPEIKKENFVANIQRLKSNTPEVCDTHGGIDCSRGRDETDASVFCYDGFIGSAQRFDDYCSNARLKHEFLVEYQEEPKILPFKKAYVRARALDTRFPLALVAEVRNVLGVEAKQVKVEFKFPYLVPSTYPATGPEAIPAFGLASYRLPQQLFPEGLQLHHFAGAKVVIECANCQ